jgi:uncharacterized membrane protein
MWSYLDIGTLGGQMGMFIGASILSVVEIIEFVCLLMTKGSQRIAVIRRKKSDASNGGLDDIPKKTSEML